MNLVKVLLPMRRLAALTAAASVLVLASACNTIDGAGQDVESLGSEIEETAKDVKD